MQNISISNYIDYELPNFCVDCGKELKICYDIDNNKEVFCEKCNQTKLVEVSEKLIEE